MWFEEFLGGPVIDETGLPGLYGFRPTRTLANPEELTFGGAGLEAVLRRTRDEIERKLEPRMSRIKVVDTIDAALAKVESKLPPEQRQKTHALVVIRADDGDIGLYETQFGMSILNRVDHPMQC